jgi:drug/metabolite transporter (DMT)-like permease
MNAGDWAQLVLLSLVWGASFFFYKILATQLPPFSVVFGRAALSLCCLLPLVWLTGTLPQASQTWKAFFVMGALNCVIPFSLIAWGESQITSGLASVLNATTPMFTVLIANFFTPDERLSSNRLAGVILGLAGVIVLIGPQALKGISLVSLAQFACIAAAISYACAAVYGRRFAIFGITPLVTATGQIAATTAMSAPLMLIFDKPWVHLPTLNLGGWGALVGIAVLSTVFAYIIYFRILRTAGATNVLLVTFLVPPSALLLGSLFLKESLTLASFLGMLLILTGLAAIDGRLIQRQRARFRRLRS